MGKDRHDDLDLSADPEPFVGTLHRLDVSSTKDWL